MPKVEIAFKSTPQMRTYMDRPTPWLNGTVRSIDKKVADKLIADHPINFMPASKFAQQVQADQQAAADASRKKHEEEFGTSPGDKVQTDGPSLPLEVMQQLKPEEVELWIAAATKADAGEDLEDKEQKIIAKVEKLLEK